MTLRIACWLVLVSTAAGGVAQAQLNTQHLKGGVGLKAGSQPPPNVYAQFPVLFLYNTEMARTKSGAKLTIEDESIASAVYAVGVVVVTDKKIFGGTYGFQALFPTLGNNRMQGTEFDQEPGAGLTDSVFQPVSLGWQRKRADVLASYTIYVPTGRYKHGALDNSGYGMWAHEVSAGTTVYLTGDRKFHASTLASISFQSKKEDSETKVGNMLILEGGLGGDFGEGLISAGLAYTAGFKLTADRFDGLAERLEPGKNKSFALGPEITFGFESNGRVFAFLKINVEWEVYARSTTQGHTVQSAVTIPFRPIRFQRRPS